MNWYKKARDWNPQQLEDPDLLKQRISDMTTDSIIAFNKKSPMVSTEEFSNFSHSITETPISYDEQRRRRLKSYNPETEKEQKRIQEEQSKPKPYPKANWSYNSILYATKIHINLNKKTPYVALSVTPQEQLQQFKTGTPSFLFNYYPLVMKKASEILQHYIGSPEYMVLRNNLRNVTHLPNLDIKLEL